MTTIKFSRYTAILLLIINCSKAQNVAINYNDDDCSYIVESSSLSKHYEVNNSVNAIINKRDVPWYVNRFKIGIGFYQALNNTNIQLGSSSGSVGTEIDFEDDLGFTKRSPTFLSSLEWRINSRSKIVLNYYNLRRDAFYRLEETIEFGDETYEVDAKVNSYFNTVINRFAYGYALLSRPNYELGLSFGAHIVGAKAGIKLDNTNLSIINQENFGFTAPLPDFGIWGNYAISNRFYVNGEFNYFALKVNQIKGSIIGFEIAASYLLLRNLELSTGLSGFNFKVEMEKRLINGDFRWGNNGLFLKAMYSFGKKNWY